MKRKNLSEKEMPFLDHLEELRWRLIKSVASIIGFMVIAFFFSDYLLDFLLYPGQQIDPPIKIQALKVQTVFVTKLEISFVTGLIFSLPVIIFQIWQFVAPGLFEKEKKFIPFIILITVGCFLIGAVFAYTIIIPYALQFLLSLAPDSIVNNIALDFYIGFLLRLIMVFGIVFEMPVLTMLLAKIRIINAPFMRKYRKYGIVGAFILGAILTPPDPSTQILLAIPLILLYEISIYIAHLVNPVKDQ